jgi:hypothetical protein
MRVEISSQGLLSQVALEAYTVVFFDSLFRFLNRGSLQYGWPIRADKLHRVKVGRLIERVGDIG